MPVPASQDVGPRKQALHKAGQPKGKSLAALALAADTLVEPGRIGVRMPGDPPRSAPSTRLIHPYCPMLYCSPLSCQAETPSIIWNHGITTVTENGPACILLK